MDLKELEKFLKICRKQGVTEITFEGTSVKLGDLPARKGAMELEEAIEEPDELTGDDLIFAAVNGGFR